MASVLLLLFVVFRDLLTIAHWLWLTAFTVYGLFICIAALLLLLLLFLYNKQSGFFNIDRYGTEEAHTDTEAVEDDPAASHDEPNNAPP